MDAFGNKTTPENLASGGGAAEFAVSTAAGGGVTTKLVSLPATVSTHPGMEEQVLGYLEVQPSDLTGQVQEGGAVYNLQPQEIEIDGEHVILASGEEAGEIILVLSTDQDDTGENAVAQLAQGGFLSAAILANPSTTAQTLTTCAQVVGSGIFTTAVSGEVVSEATAKPVAEFNTVACGDDDDDDDMDKECSHDAKEASVVCSTATVQESEGSSISIILDESCVEPEHGADSETDAPEVIVDECVSERFSSLNVSEQVAESDGNAQHVSSDEPKSSETTVTVTSQNSCKDRSVTDSPIIVNLRSTSGKNDKSEDLETSLEEMAVHQPVVTTTDSVEASVPERETSVNDGSAISIPVPHPEETSVQQEESLPVKTVENELSSAQTSEELDSSMHVDSTTSEHPKPPYDLDHSDEDFVVGSASDDSDTEGLRLLTHALDNPRIHDIESIPKEDVIALSKAVSSSAASSEKASTQENLTEEKNSEQTADEQSSDIEIIEIEEVEEAKNACGAKSESKEQAASKEERVPEFITVGVIDSLHPIIIEEGPEADDAESSKEEESVKKEIQESEKKVYEVEESKEKDDEECEIIEICEVDPKEGSDIECLSDTIKETKQESKESEETAEVEADDDEAMDVDVEETERPAEPVESSDKVTSSQDTTVVEAKDEEPVDEKPAEETSETPELLQEPEPKEIEIDVEEVLDEETHPDAEEIKPVEEKDEVKEAAVEEEEEEEDVNVEETEPEVAVEVDEPEEKAETTSAAPVEEPEVISDAEDLIVEKEQRDEPEVVEDAKLSEEEKEDEEICEKQEEDAETAVIPDVPTEVCESVEQDASQDQTEDVVHDDVAEEEEKADESVVERIDDDDVEKIDEDAVNVSDEIHEEEKEEEEQVTCREMVEEIHEDEVRQEVQNESAEADDDADDDAGDKVDDDDDARDKVDADVEMKSDEVPHDDDEQLMEKEADESQQQEDAEDASRHTEPVDTTREVGHDAKEDQSENEALEEDTEKQDEKDADESADVHEIAEAGDAEEQQSIVEDEVPMKSDKEEEEESNLNVDADKQEEESNLNVDADKQEEESNLNVDADKQEEEEEVEEETKGTEEICNKDEEEAESSAASQIKIASSEEIQEEVSKPDFAEELPQEEIPEASQAQIALEDTESLERAKEVGSSVVIMQGEVPKETQDSEMPPDTKEQSSYVSIEICEGENVELVVQDQPIEEKSSVDESKEDAQDEEYQATQELFPEDDHSEDKEQETLSEDVADDKDANQEMDADEVVEPEQKDTMAGEDEVVEPEQKDTMAGEDEQDMVLPEDEILEENEDINVMLKPDDSTIADDKMSEDKMEETEQALEDAKEVEPTSPEQIPEEEEEQLGAEDEADEKEAEKIEDSENLDEASKDEASEKEKAVEDDSSAKKDVESDAEKSQDVQVDDSREHLTPKIKEAFRKLISSDKSIAPKEPEVDLTVMKSKITTKLASEANKLQEKAKSKDKDAVAADADASESYGQLPALPEELDDAAREAEVQKRLKEQELKSAMLNEQFESLRASIENPSPVVENGTKESDDSKKSVPRTGARRGRKPKVAIIKSWPLRTRKNAQSTPIASGESQESSKSSGGFSPKAFDSSMDSVQSNAEGESQQLSVSVGTEIDTSLDTTWSSFISNKSADGDSPKSKRQGRVSRDKTPMKRRQNGAQPRRVLLMSNDNKKVKGDTDLYDDASKGFKERTKKSPLSKYYHRGPREGKGVKRSYSKDSPRATKFQKTGMGFDKKWEPRRFDAKGLISKGRHVRSHTEPNLSHASISFGKCDVKENDDDRKTVSFAEKQCDFRIRYQINKTPPSIKQNTYICSMCSFTTTRLDNAIRHYKDQCPFAISPDFFSWEKNFKEQMQKRYEERQKRAEQYSSEEKTPKPPPPAQSSSSSSAVTGGKGKKRHFSGGDGGEKSSTEKTAEKKQKLSSSFVEDELDELGISCLDSDDSEDMPSPFEIQTKNVFGFSEEDVVWAEWKNIHWPALVRKLYPKTKKVSVMFIDNPAPKRLVRLHKKKIATFNNADQNKKFIGEGRFTPHEDAFMKAVQKAESFLRKRGLGSNISVREFFEHFDEFELLSDDETSSVAPSDSGKNTVSERQIGDANSSRSVTPVSFTDIDKEEEDIIHETIPEVTDSEALARMKEKRKQQNAKLLRCIKDGKVETHLLGVYRRTIPSDRHNKFNSDVLSERKQLKHVSWFGPIDDEEQQEEIYDYCLQHFKSNCEYPENFDVVAYMFEVWVPEAIVKAISRVKRITIEQAEAVFAKGVELTELEQRELNKEFERVTMTEEEKQEHLKESVEQLKVAGIEEKVIGLLEG